MGPDLAKAHQSHKFLEFSHMLTMIIVMATLLAVALVTTKEPSSVASRHLLPFRCAHRAKAIITTCLLPFAEWEKVAKGRMRAIWHPNAKPPPLSHHPNLRLPSEHKTTPQHPSSRRKSGAISVTQMDPDFRRDDVNLSRNRMDCHRKYTNATKLGRHNHSATHAAIGTRTPPRCVKPVG